MSTVLAAIDDSATAGPVLAMSRALATLLGTSLRAIHVRVGDPAPARAAAEHAGIPLEVVDGDPITEIVRVVGDPDTALVVIGARRDGAQHDTEGSRPAGHVAIAVAEQAVRPVLVVPPESGRGDVPPSIRRALLPLEGTAETSGAISTVLHELAHAGVELVVVHVFDAHDVPAFWDAPAHAEQSYASEFAARWCEDEPTVRVRLRRGAAPTAIVDVAEREAVDLIALGWSQHLDPGRARIVHAALTESHTPVLLLPLPGRVSPSSDRTPR